MFNNSLALKTSTEKQKIQTNQQPSKENPTQNTTVQPKKVENPKDTTLQKSFEKLEIQEKNDDDDFVKVVFTN